MLETEHKSTTFIACTATQRKNYARHITHTHSRACAATISGTPYLNFACSVLCRHTRIPARAPTPPPAKTTAKSVLSAMREEPLFAFSLSIPKRRNAKPFTASRQNAAKYHITAPQSTT